MPKMPIEFFALFNVSYCFFFCAAAAEALATEEVGSGEIGLEPGSSFLNQFGKKLGAVIDSHSVSVHLSVMTCTKSERNFLCPCLLH